MMLDDDDNHTLDHELDFITRVAADIIGQAVDQGIAPTLAAGAAMTAAARWLAAAVGPANAAAAYLVALADVVEVGARDYLDA
jgi:hypothetical protein